MKTNANKTEAQEKQEKAKAILTIKFAQVEAGSLKFWHYLSIASEESEDCEK